MSVNQIRPTLELVAQERLRQTDKWGHQNHPDGTGRADDRWIAEATRQRCDDAFAAGEWDLPDEADHYESDPESFIKWLGERGYEIRPKGDA